MPKHACLFASWPFLILSTNSTVIHGTVSELLWPQMRSSIANYLVKNNILDGPVAYTTVFEKIPESGNCWCFSDKHETEKSEPQDLYDFACRRFHYCVRCGYNSDISDYDENVSVAFTKESVLNFSVTAELTDIIETNNIMNFDADSNSVSVYEWDCESTQSEAGMAQARSSL